MAVSRHGPLQITDLFADKGVHLTLFEARFFDALLGRERLLTPREIIEHMYPDEDGGPLTADSILQVVVCRCRKKLAESGIPWRIENEHSLGWRLRYLWLWPHLATDWHDSQDFC
jgi:DNA-binding response OmpR family regulator